MRQIPYKWPKHDMLQLQSSNKLLFRRTYLDEIIRKALMIWETKISLKSWALVKRLVNLELVLIKHVRIKLGFWTSLVLCQSLELALSPRLSCPDSRWCTFLLVSAQLQKLRLKEPNIMIIGPARSSWCARFFGNWDEFCTMKIMIRAYICLVAR